MLLKTILNRVERNQSFVYGEAKSVTDETGQANLEIPILARANGRPICSGCQRPGPGYDRLAERRFEYVLLWAIPVFFLYALRRVDCPRCGVTVEKVPWGDGKSTLTNSYRWFLAGWVQRLSWKETAEAFGATWDKVYSAVQHAVFWGALRRSLTKIKTIGVDEIQWKRGHKYLTLVYQIDQGVRRLLASKLAKEFTTLFRQHRGEDLAAWIERASAEAVPVDVRRIAQDLRTDLPANQAAATLPWSNGQTEGQINRLKLTKREMYGRAKLDLLRKRFVIKSGVG